MTKEKILALLRASADSFISGEELARRTGFSRTMVWKHVRALEREGFEIEAVPSQGYRIISSPDTIRLADIKPGLKTKIIGKSVHLLSETASTNTYAMELAMQGAVEGTVVIAESQSGGKGRLGRPWISPKGNLYCSVILRPPIPVHKAPLTTLLGAVAVASAIRLTGPLDCRIKWPNDLYLSGKKTGGLLTEMSAEQDRIRYVVLGIGINVNMDLNELPADVRAQATSLAGEAGEKINRVSLLRQCLREIDRWYQRFLILPADIVDEWTRLNMTLGNRVTVSGSDALEGWARGIDEEGRLLIEQDNGSIRTVSAGDVSIRPATGGPRTL